MTVIRSIIFDFFDVFRTDSYKAWLAKNNFERTGAFAEASNLSDAGKIDNKEFLRLISEAAGWTVTHEEIDTNAVVNHEMVDFARTLKVMYATSLLSNAPSEFLRAQLHLHKLDDLFDEVFVSAEMGVIKPSAEAFQYVLKAIGAAPGETLFIDDNPHNVEAAKALGIVGIQFTSVTQLKADLDAAGISY